MLQKQFVTVTLLRSEYNLINGDILKNPSGYRKKNELFSFNANTENTSDVVK